jgi:hypothetical protein
VFSSILGPSHKVEVALAQSLSGCRRGRAPVRSAIASLQIVVLVATMLCGLKAIAQTAAPASLASPAQGSVLAGSSATFSWPASGGATAYMLYLGTTGTGSSNLFNSGSTTSTSLSVNTIPANGLAVYARLSSNIGGVWEHTDSTYFEAGSAAQAAIVSPVPGSQLAGSSTTFSWTPGVGATSYLLYVGTTGTGSSNIFNSGSTTATSLTVSAIPTNASNLYVRLFSMVNGYQQFMDYIFAEAGTPAEVALISPASGSQFTGSTVNFSWTAGSATDYQLYLGTTGSGTDNLHNSGLISATALAVSGLPTSGDTVYARLRWMVAGMWKYADYTFTEAGTPSPAALTSPAPGSQLAGSAAKFDWTPGTGASAYKLLLGTNGAGSSNLFNSGSTTATSASVSSLPTSGVMVYARLLTNVNGSWEPMDYTFTEAGTPAPAALISPAPGSQISGTSAAFTWTPGVGATHYMLYVGTTGAGSSNLFNSGSTTATSAGVSGLPANGSALYAKLASYINGSWQFANYTFVSGARAATLSGISCSSASITGSGSDSCTVTLSAAASSNRAIVNLASSSSSATVPSAVTIQAGASSASFTLTATAVATAQTATLTASLNGTTQSFPLQLNAASMGLSAASVSFGNVMVNSSATQSVSVMSTGNVPVTVNSASVSGPGFAVSGATFPMTLTPGQSATLAVKFKPTAVGAASGMLTLSSNATTGSTATVSLSGAGAVALSGISCGTTSFTGAGSAACIATLNAAAPAGGLVVNLSSSSSSVTVPASITVPANATSAGFSATVNSVTSAQSVNLTATENSASTTFTLQLNASTPTLSLSSSSVAFGSVTVNSPSTQSITLTATGNAAVTINSATLAGTGFSLAAQSFPITLTAGQAATLEVEFDPTAAGAAAGQLTIASNSSNGTAVVSLTGTGAALNYEVNLSWTAPSSPSDPIAGYNVYRAASGSTMYQLLNTSVETGVAFVDTTVQAGATYDYYIESVDETGIRSAPSATVAMVIQ